MKYAYIDSEGNLLAYGHHDLHISEVQEYKPDVVEKIEGAPEGLQLLFNEQEIIPEYIEHFYSRKVSGDGTNESDWELIVDLRSYKFKKNEEIEGAAWSRLQYQGFIWDGKTFKLNVYKKVNYSIMKDLAVAGVLPYPVKVYSRYYDVIELNEAQEVIDFYNAGVSVALPVHQWVDNKIQVVMAATTTEEIDSVDISDIP